MGPGTLFVGFRRYCESNERGNASSTAWILEEMDNLNRTDMSPIRYDNLFRNRTDFGCNHVVHDPHNNIPYFYSRVLGTDLCPCLENQLSEQKKIL